MKTECRFSVTNLVQDSPCWIIHQCSCYIDQASVGVNCEVHQSSDRFCCAITQQLVS